MSCDAMQGTKGRGWGVSGSKPVNSPRGPLLFLKDVLLIYMLSPVSWGISNYNPESDVRTPLIQFRSK